MSIGERIKLARKNAHMTQQDLAEAVGVAKSTIAGYEIGVREPDSIRIYRIAKALGVSGDYLLDIEIEPAPDYIPSPEALKVAKDFDALTEEGKRLALGFFALLEQVHRKP